MVPTRSTGLSRWLRRALWRPSRNHAGGGAGVGVVPTRSTGLSRWLRRALWRPSRNHAGDSAGVGVVSRRSLALAPQPPEQQRRGPVGASGDPCLPGRPSRLDRHRPSDERALMGLLEQVTGPGDLRDLTDDQLTALASEIRDELVRTCAPRGGHLGPNLGVVELTLAIHRVFDSPRDRVVFDTGHQAYVHKMLTGRATPVRHPAHRGRPVRLPQPGRVRPRRGRELPRLHLAVLRRRAGQGLRAAR